MSIYITFNYVTDKKNPRIVETFCFVFDDNKNLIAQASSVNNIVKGDKYNKFIGREIAFTKAIKAFDKQTRTDMWKYYFCHFKTSFFIPREQILNMIKDVIEDIKND